MMATVKSYTDIEQSKKLAKILPLESADMCCFQNQNGSINYYGFPFLQGNKDSNPIPCWSLAALLNVLPYPTLYQQGDGAWGLDAWVEQVKPYSIKNAICEVDACYEMIVKLHEQKLL